MEWLVWCYDGHVSTVRKAARAVEMFVWEVGRGDVGLGLMEMLCTISQRYRTGNDGLRILGRSSDSINIELIRYLPKHSLISY